MKKGCKFCGLLTSGTEVVFMTEKFAGLLEAAPVSLGHILIISRDHYADAFELPHDVWEDFGRVLAKAKEYICMNNSPDGFNVGVNCGREAGQTQFHFHAHIIPRYVGDVPDPVGGVRSILGNVPPKL